MTLSKQEFKVLVMLYAANIDGNIQSEEVKIMLEKTDFDTVEKVEKLFCSYPTTFLRLKRYVPGLSCWKVEKNYMMTPPKMFVTYTEKKS